MSTFILLEAGHVDVVVLAGRSHELDPHGALAEPRLDDQAVLVATDVEDDALGVHDARVREVPLDVRRRSPIGPARDRVPCLEGLLRSGVALPEGPQRPKGDDSHDVTL